MGNPCAANPELWFGYPDDDGGDGAAKARAYERSATEARIQCLRRCPLLQQRRCAEHAIAHGEEYGVWAGVKLPGGPKTRRCWRVTNMRPFRWLRWCCICRPHKLGPARPPDNPSASPAVSL
jgi:Transcription factor WhiB